MKLPNTVREIITEWLKEHGYDGLAGEECGCSLKNLMPCDNPELDECFAGYIHTCDCGQHTFHIEPQDHKECECDHCKDCRCEARTDIICPPEIQAIPLKGN